MNTMLAGFLILKLLTYARTCYKTMYNANWNVHDDDWAKILVKMLTIVLRMMTIMIMMTTTTTTTNMYKTGINNYINKGS